MKKNTKKIVILLSIIAIIVILVAGAILYLTTDLFKSNKELFLKYAVQNGEMISAYIENKNEQNINLVENDKYITKGTVTFDLVSNDNEVANQMLPARNFSIDFDSQVDPISNKDSSQIYLKFLNENLFNLKYAHNKDLYAITSNEVINKYLAFDNNNLKELVQKYGITDVTNIPNKIEPINYLELFKISDEDASYIARTYLNAINDNIPKEKYYNNKNITIYIDGREKVANCYGISLTSEEYKNIVINLLIQLQQDDRTLNLVLEKVKMLDEKTEITLNSFKDAISGLISELQDSNEFENTKIEVYEYRGELIKTVIESGNKVTIDYQKNEDSVRILLTNEYKEDNTKTQANSNNELDDNMYETSINNNLIENNMLQEASTISNINTQDLTSQFRLKSIEMAKQEQLGENNNVVIITLETNNNKCIKVSVQEKKNQDTKSKSVKNNLTINISDVETTYFEIMVDSIKTPSSDPNVEELTNENSAIINNFSPEYSASLLQAISNRLQKLFNDKMQMIASMQSENV